MNASDLIRYTPLASAGRFATIMAVLAKHGFGELMERLGLRRRRFFRRKSVTEAAALPLWVKLRRVIEDLGPTAIKIGQILSMRPDMIPPQLSEELRQLQENVPPAPYHLIERTLVESLGKPIADIFSDFERKPVATASISQVHRARLLENGKLVAVKVRLPGVVDTIMADLDIMEFFAAQIEERFPAVRKARPRQVVRSLRKDVARELDFTNEAVNMYLFNELFDGEPDLFAPAVYGQYAREDVLVMDFIEGARLDECSLTCTPERRDHLARVGLKAAVRQILEEGFFHADPHLGNLRIVDGCRLCYLDFGMCGRLTPAMRSSIIDFLITIGENDAAKAVRVILEMAASYAPDIDPMGFETDLAFAMQKARVPFKHGSFGRFMIEVTTICHDHGVILRPDFILIARALLATESAGRTLSPKLDAMQSLAELAKGYALRRLTPWTSDKPLFGDAEEVLRALAKIPVQLSDILRRLEAGELALELKQHDYGIFPANLRRIGNRLGGALVTSALAIGSSVIYLSNLGPQLWGMPLMGLLGFAASGLLGLYLTFKMFRNT
jgi:ubiquinone biosynthesis protein